jgi:hypothetical protein
MRPQRTRTRDSRPLLFKQAGTRAEFTQSAEIAAWRVNAVASPRVNESQHRLSLSANARTITGPKAAIGAVSDSRRRRATRRTDASSVTTVPSRASLTDSSPLR